MFLKICIPKEFSLKKKITSLGQTVCRFTNQFYQTLMIEKYIKEQQTIRSSLKKNTHMHKMLKSFLKIFFFFKC